MENEQSRLNGCPPAVNAVTAVTAVTASHRRSADGAGSDVPISSSVRRRISGATLRLRARVTAVDDSDVQRLGNLDYGSQHLEVEVLSGSAKGGRFRANNEIRAQAELDKQFRVGDTALVIVPPGGAKPGEELVARDHWRLGWIAVLFGAFCALLCAFGGWTGAQALFSFLFCQSKSHEL